MLRHIKRVLAAFKSFSAAVPAHQKFHVISPSPHATARHGRFGALADVTAASNIFAWVAKMLLMIATIYRRLRDDDAMITTPHYQQNRLDADFQESPLPHDKQLRPSIIFSDSVISFDV